MENDAIIYRRVSTAKQERKGYSLEGQEVAARAYCAEKGLNVKTVITEGNDSQQYGSGAVRDRDGLNLIRKAIDEGIKHIIICFPDRLSRDFTLAILLMDEMQKKRIAVHDVSEGRILWSDESKRLEDLFRFWQAEEERHRFRERVHRGKLTKLRKGQPLGINEPYGYRFVREKRDMHVEINEEEAQVVRMIYHWYVYGDGNKPMSVLAITKRLTEMRIPTQRDRTGGIKLRGFGNWDSSTVYAMLREETYAGVKYENRYSRASGRQVERPKEEWIAIPVPPIVDRALWEAAKAKRDQGRALAKGHVRRQYLLGNRIRCTCGFSVAGMTGGQRKVRYYRCISRSQSTGACGAQTFNADRLERSVLDWAQQEFLNPNTQAHKLCNMERATTEEQRQIEAESYTLQAQRADLDQRRQRWKEAYEAGIIDLAEFSERLTSLAGPISRLDEQIEVYVAQLRSIQVAVAMIDKLRALANRLIAEQKTLRDEEFATQRWLMDQLDIHITLAVENGEKVVYVKSPFLQDSAVRLTISS